MGNKTSSSKKSAASKSTASVAPAKEEHKGEEKSPLPVAPTQSLVFQTYFENRPLLKKHGQEFLNSLKQDGLLEGPSDDRTKTINAILKRLLTPIPAKIADELAKEDLRATRLSGFMKHFPAEYKKLMAFGSDLKADGREFKQDASKLFDGILDVFDSIKTKKALTDSSPVIYEWADADGFPPHAVTSELPSSDQFTVTQLFNPFPVLYFALDLLITSDGLKFNSFESYRFWGMPSPNGILPSNIQTLAYDYPPEAPTDGNRPGAWSSDNQYGNQRFNGFSAAVIQKVADPLSIPEADRTAIGTELQSRFGVELKTATQNDQIFVEDYSFLAGCQDPGYTSVSNLKWQPVTVAYFFFNKDSNQLILFWIKVSGVNNKVSWTGNFTATMGEWPWRWAKSCLQASAFQYHEAGSHLTLTHLVEEVFATSMRIVFADTDPLFYLLNSHFVRTFAINDKARSTLAPGALTVLSGTNLNGVMNMVNAHFKNFGDVAFESHYLPQDLARRGFVSGDAPLYTKLPYYYAQDGMQIWASLNAFAQAFVLQFYPTIDSVKTDAKLKAWVQQVRSHGMPHFPDFQGSAERNAQEQLGDALCYIMFNASVQHSAVNYLQAYYMSYGAATPAYMTGDFPTPSENWTEQRVVNSLPGFLGNVLQVAILAILSQPVKAIDNGPLPMVGAMEYAVTSLPALKPAFQSFQTSMTGITSAIAARNTTLQQAGQIPYSILDPVNNVANSIQI